MKKPVVDYRQFRFSKLNSPTFRHLKLLWSWPVYLAVFFIASHFIPPKDAFFVHSPLDDMIPFCEWLVLPYVGWYLLIVGSLLHFALYDIEGFKKLQTFLMITHIVAIVFYLLLPTRIDLRPEVFPHDNILTDLVGLLYAVDTPTNACPSMHVAVSLAIASAWAKAKAAPTVSRIVAVCFALAVCASTVLIKQHSIIDGFAAVAMCLPIELIVYRKWYAARVARCKSRRLDK